MLIERRVEEEEVREECMRSRAACGQKEVEVGRSEGVLTLQRTSEVRLSQLVVCLGIVHAFLHLEDLYREDGYFALAQALDRSREELTDHHTSLLGGIGTVVDGTKDDLIPST